MKATRLIAVTAIAGAALLSACGTKSSDATYTSSNKPASTTTTVQRTTSTTISKTIMEDAFVEATRDLYPGLSRAKAIELGKTTCDTIDQFGSVEQTVTAIIASGDFVGMESDVGYMMGVSIPVFCPEYLAEAERLFK